MRLETITMHAHFLQGEVWALLHAHYKASHQLMLQVWAWSCHFIHCFCIPTRLTCACTRCCLSSCRRLSPSFKVRVEVRYRQRVAVPITVKAHLVTQQDKDNILAWLPDDYTPYTGLEDKSQVRHPMHLAF